MHTSILWETQCKRRILYFDFKDIFLVQEENNGGVLKPTIITDRVKQYHTLSHTILKYIII